MHGEIVLAALVLVVAILVAADYFRRTSDAPHEHPAGNEPGNDQRLAHDAGPETYPARLAGSAASLLPYEVAVAAPRPARARMVPARPAFARTVPVRTETLGRSRPRRFRAGRRRTGSSAPGWACWRSPPRRPPPSPPPVSSARTVPSGAPRPTQT